MSGGDSVVGEWVQKAENDLLTAVHTLKLGRTCPTDTVCFHAQQCVEKYVKALLVHLGTELPRTHHIGALVSLLPPGQRPVLTAAEELRLTSYAAMTRYPGTYKPISLSEARKAVAVARRVRRDVRKHLQALR
jgi:HEPN domain-containing protein